MHKVRIVENIISFDFDGTLDDDFDGTLNIQKDEIQTICKELINQGKNVYIITKRYDNNTFPGESEKVYELAKELGIKDVYFTNRELKHTKVQELGIQVHFENDSYEAEVIQNHNHSTLVVNVEDPYWRDLVY